MKSLNQSYNQNVTSYYYTLYSPPKGLLNWRLPPTHTGPLYLYLILLTIIILYLAGIFRCRYI
jgi:hypothetical protein